MRDGKLLTITALVAACLCICWGATSFASPPSTAAKQTTDAKPAAAARPDTTVSSATKTSPASLQTPAKADKPTIGKEPGEPGEPGGPRQGGDTCADAVVISDPLPQTVSGDTRAAWHDYDAICPYNGPGAPDVVYSYTPTADIRVDLTMCIGTTDYNTKLYIYGGVCSGTPIACNDDACSSPHYSNWVSELLDVNLTGGTTYYIIVDGYTGERGHYTLSISERVICDVVCAPAGISENEPDCADGYVDATNGGCNSTPNVFRTIACNTTVCGKSGTYLLPEFYARDTDWYRIVTTEQTSFTWSATAEFPLLIFAIRGPCPGKVLFWATADPCGTATVITGPQPAGEYYLWIGPSAFTGATCGAEYVATLTTDTCAPICTTCPGDVSGDGVVDGRDVQGFVDCVLGGGSNCPCGDFDDSGTVDLDDVNDFVAALLGP